MPYFDGVAGRVHYRHWPADAPQAAVIFLHGFGEHSGLYERLAGELTRAGSSCGRSTRSATACPKARAGWSARSTRSRPTGAAHRARARRVPRPPARPRRTLARRRDRGPGDRPRSLALGGAVLSGTPIEPPDWVTALEPGAALVLDANDLSTDPWYLDALANDPLAFTESEGGPADALPPAWHELGSTFAGGRAPGPVRPWQRGPGRPGRGQPPLGAPSCRTRAWPSSRAGRHDILNDSAHADVAAAIADFVLERRHALA